MYKISPKMRGKNIDGNIIWNLKSFLLPILNVFIVQNVHEIRKVKKNIIVSFVNNVNNSIFINFKFCMAIRLTQTLYV